MRALSSRRHFIAQTLPLSAAAAICAPRLLAADANRQPAPQLVVFSKVYQELKLGFEQAAALTADAGLDGIDCPVRPGGEILPERAAQDLPQYSALLRQRNLAIPLITTGITSTTSPHAEEILRTAWRLGVRHYRLGSLYREDRHSIAEQIRSFRNQLEGLGKLNRQIGIGALVQNHSPAGRTYLGGDLTEMRDIVAGFAPAEIGVAFDIAHALVVHGDQWREHFEALKPHIRIIYVKDVKRNGGWTQFGDGDIGKTDYFDQIRKMGYTAPISIHIEFDWAAGSKTPASLSRALKHSASVLRGWLSGR